VRRVLLLGFIALYAGVWAATALLPLPGNDIDAFFWPSVREALDGHPLLVYMPLGQAPYPNANGPLALLPLTAVGAVVRALGWMDAMHLRRAVIMGFFCLFVLVMAREAMIAVDALRGMRVRRFTRLLAYASLILAPIIWQGLGGYGHVEQPIELWMLLLAALWLTIGRQPGSAATGHDRGRGTGEALGAGVAFGLAVLSRTPAALFGLPLAIAAWRRGPLRAVTMALAAAATVAAGIMPFYLADRADVTHSLLSYRGSLPVGAGSIWSMARATGWESLAQHWDLVFVGAAIIAVNLWLALRGSLGGDGPGLYAALALTAGCFCLLAKTVWPYYFVEVYVFTAVWAFTRRGRPRGRLWRVIPLLGLTGLGILAEAGATQDLPLFVVRLEGAAMFVLLAGAILWMALVAARPAGAGSVKKKLPGAG
jgi:hypothetical protein